MGAPTYPPSAHKTPITSHPITSSHTKWGNHHHLPHTPRDTHRGTHHPPPPQIPPGSREAKGEVEALAEPTESEEGAWGEAAGAHGAEGLLIVPRGALAPESPHQQVQAGAPIPADSWGAAAPPGTQLTMLPCVTYRTPKLG